MELFIVIFIAAFIAFRMWRSRRVSGFVSSIWQVHPFCEGNTRTVATFPVLYLQNLGIDIDEEPFCEHARFFRDALVRSNYASAKDGIVPDKSFLRMFF